MGKLEDFLKSFGYDEFKKFVTGKLAIGKKGELMAYKFRGKISELISGFLKANAKITEKFARDSKVEEEYIEKLKAEKAEVAGVVTDEALRKKVENNFDKIGDVFSGLFGLKSPLELLIVKQYEQRLKIRIEKYPFPKDSEDLIYEGLFLVAVVHCLAKKDKAAAEAAELASEGKPATAKKEKIKPEKQPMNEVLNSPNYIGKLSDEDGVCFGYVGDFRFRKTSVEKYSQLKKAFLSCYLDGVEPPNSVKDKKFIEDFSEWVNKYKESINALPQFRKEVQEDPHEVLITEDNANNQRDPFINFLFKYGYYRDMLFYPYFFNGSVKKELSVGGKKVDGIVGYTYPKGVDVFAELSVDDLDRLLKPIYFRDVTDGNKSYKKMSAEKLHGVVDAYQQLLWRKIIKYVRMTYQCEKDKILVSFTTNNFDLPPQFDKEADFKERFKANPGRALYRGMSDAKQFEDMKTRGLSSNARHHHEQWFGPGLYWTKDFKQAKDGFASRTGAVVAMAVACEDFPNIVKDAADDQRYRELFLMRDHECLYIREKAMCDVRELPNEILELLKKNPNYKNVVFCKTQEDIDDWLNCK